MFSLNRVHIIGYQTQPIEPRKTPSGLSVTDLNLVTPYTFTQQNGQELGGKAFHVVTLWGVLAEIAARYGKQGDQFFVSGRLQTDSWEDAQTKERRSRTKIVAQDLILLNPKSGAIDASAFPPALTGCLNRADIIGNLTRDPELRTTTSGQHVLTLGLATNERWKSKATGEDQERTEYHTIVCWGELASLCHKHLKKGQKLHAGGRVQSRSWQTPQGGKRVTTEIIAEAVSLLGTASPLVLAAEGAQELGSSGETPTPEAAVAADAPNVPVSTFPEISYEPTVKVEDLPF